MGRNDQPFPQGGLALAQGQGRGAAQPVYLSHLLGEDNETRTFAKEKETGTQLQATANLPHSLQTKAEVNQPKSLSEK